MIKKLDAVSDKITPLFEEAAKELIAKCKDDPLKAVCTALAYISGHYKGGILVSRSLLNGFEHFITF